MSHSVTITTTIPGSGGRIIYNTGYLKTIPGLLKLFQLILGAACVGITAYYFQRFQVIPGTPDLFFLLMTTTFLICTFCLLLSCIISLSTGGLVSKTIYELIYHSVATILLLACSLMLIIEVNRYRLNSQLHDAYLAASIIGLINTVLYCISAIYAQRSYRGI